LKRSQARFSFIFIYLKPCKTFDQRSLNGQKKDFNATYSSHDLDIYHHKRRKLFFFGGGNLLEQKWEMNWE